MGAVVAMGFPAIVPASVFGQTAPSNRINIGAIGVGRISRGHDLPGIWQFDQARIMAVCDLDANRVDQAKTLINAIYANGVTMDISGDFPNGIKFYGTEGWIFVTRDEMVTPTDSGKPGVAPQPLAASNPKVLDCVIGPDEVHLYQSNDQHGNWLECIKSRKAPTAPAEIGHRACSTCLIDHIAMKTKRRLSWDPIKEHFKNDDEANCMQSRPQRAPYMMDA